MDMRIFQRIQCHEKGPVKKTTPMKDFGSSRRCCAAGRRSVTALVQYLVDIPKLRGIMRENAGRLPWTTLESEVVSERSNG